MLITFQEWRKKQVESSASTRSRREIALGLRTSIGMGSLHGHSTALPWEVENITKKKKKKKKKLIHGKKKN